MNRPFVLQALRNSLQFNNAALLPSSSLSLSSTS